MTSHRPGIRPRRATSFLVARQERMQRSVPRCRAPFGGSLVPGAPGGVFANSPCGLKHAKPFFRPSHPPVGTSEGAGKAGDRRPVPVPISVEARCVRKARSDPAEQRSSRRGSRPKADRGWRVAFFASFLGEARKEVACRGRRRGFAEHAPRRRSRPGVQTRPWKIPGQCNAKQWKARKQELKRYLSKRKRFPYYLTRT